MTNQEATLAAKVKAWNRVNGCANVLTPDLLNAVRPFLNQKIELNKGGLTDKLKKALARFTVYNSDYQVWFSTGHGYSLNAYLKLSVHAEGTSHCVYADQTIYLGDIQNGVLTLIRDEPKKPLRIDRTVEEVLQARIAVRVARDAMRTAEAELYGFGEHDN